MPIHFACKHCGQKLNVSSEKAGVRSKCPKCAQPLVVPQPYEVVATTAAGPGKPNAPKRPPEKPEAKPPAPRKRIEASVEKPAAPVAEVAAPVAKKSVVPTPAPQPVSPPALKEPEPAPVPNCFGTVMEGKWTSAWKEPEPAPVPNSAPESATVAVVGPPTPPETDWPAEETSGANDNESNTFPFPEFSTYEQSPHDDHHEFIYIDEDAEPAPIVDRNRVAVARWVLYSQGGLLMVMALFGFALGFLSGGGRGPAKNLEPNVPQRCFISGRVLYTVESGEKFPDDGAVIVVLSQTEKPNVDEKVNYEGLRPSDPPPSDIHDGVSIIRQIGGAYGRADSKGEFRVHVPDVGKYYVLVLSQRSKRKVASDFKKSDLAQMGHYFVAAIDFIGDRRYRWLAEDVYRDRRLNLVLE